MIFYDWTMILLLPAILFTFIAQGMVKSNFDKYSKMRNSRGITGQQAARRVLDQHGLNNVKILRVAGHLTDHYNPKEKTLSLSESVFDKDSVAAVSVACHEVGHAIQDAEGYSPLNIRNSIVPVVNLASALSWPLAIIGLILLSYNGQIGNTVFHVAVIAFVVVIAFHLVTLPVELNASHRALVSMEEAGILGEDEKIGGKKVLRAAALTYVATLAVAIANLLRLLVLRGSRD